MVASMMLSPILGMIRLKSAMSQRYAQDGIGIQPLLTRKEWAKNVKNRTYFGQRSNNTESCDKPEASNTAH